jgi:tetraacyldisaccharide 4'-kinase
LYQNHILSSRRLLVPVIVVGNITVGGTGKTPFTIALAQQLIELGWQPLIISRGHGGTAQQQAVTADNTATEVGDEPLLMARRNICPVWIGKIRGATARMALRAHPECNVLLCDDGLQHYSLQRDVEIAVVDGDRRFGNGLLLPAGPLREPVSRLNEVDAIVVNGGEPATGQYAMQLNGNVFYNLLNPDKTATAHDFQGSRNHAIAGIGNPQRFFNHLGEMGIILTSHAFSDHHHYTANDLNFDDCDAILLTEKDAVKCDEFADERYWVLRVDAQYDPALMDLIQRKIS